MVAQLLILFSKIEIYLPYVFLFCEIFLNTFAYFSKNIRTLNYELLVLAI